MGELPKNREHFAARSCCRVVVAPVKRRLQLDCLPDAHEEVTETRHSGQFGSWRVRWRAVPNLGLSPMLQRLSIRLREIEQETIDAVRLNTGPPQAISLMPKVF